MAYVFNLDDYYYALDNFYASFRYCSQINYFMSWYALEGNYDKWGQYAYDYNYQIKILADNFYGMFDMISYIQGRMPDDDEIMEAWLRVANRGRTA